MRQLTALLLVLSVLPCSSNVQAPADRQAPPKIPLVVGLITVSAVHEPGKGDYESILTIDRISPEGVSFSVSANVEDERKDARRRVRRQDMERAHHWHPRYNGDDPEVFPGTTAGTGVSAAVLDELKTKGETAFVAVMADNPVSNLFQNLWGKEAGGLASAVTGPDTADSLTGTLRRVEAHAVPVAVLVDDARVELPAIHARGTLSDEQAEFYFLDDPALPLVLSFHVGEIDSRIIKIRLPAAAAPAGIEERLTASRRAEVYGIYFDFGKSTIRPESEPVLKEIGAVLSKNASWTLSVEGHTDNIGGDGYNLDLSKRRSAAVRQALADRYHIPATRLTTTGFGASRPKESNDTLEGRARNRRVELVRQ
jgi:OOP family OmpA-OmpF porin